VFPAPSVDGGDDVIDDEDTVRVVAVEVDDAVLARFFSS